MRRVVVTGMGVVSAIGTGVDQYREAIAGAKGGIGPIETISTERLTVRTAAEVKGFDPAAHFTQTELTALDRFSQFALVAAREAMASSGLTMDETLAPRAACIVGSGAGGQLTIEEGFRRLYEEGKHRVPPLTVPRYMSSAAVSQVSMALGLKGPSFGVSSACATATHAIGLGFQMVRGGLADVAVVGGAEAPLSMGCIKSWEALRVVSKDTCRPFCKDRTGMVLGEGAGIFVLETLDAARRRGAPILAEVIGFGMSADAGDLLSPSPEGAARAVRAALDDAAIAPEVVTYVNAHGTGTAANDGAETKAIHQVFGAHAPTLMVSSTKSFHGHALGASGAIELVATVMAVHDGLVAPTLNFTTPDPECDLDYVPNDPRHEQVDVALSNSFAFGGLNAVLAVRRFAG
ncbi:beta-ketoacyl-[acyl-carrier-protein] synthase family protein [Pararhodospirillum oryzae]|uniref:Nodulation protein E n=1 Tax=Pararhodospirillum oryzae TaxID=478448 RepID=A0A512HA64_9PROT|nr:beta-ketoacyl-[acyl-carrier-protein] synthase family protein [Pararhodospirillum oryzae]GEO82354.1 3-oxoacyl-ACP synthase II [Pararhodospirillum oryzae]